jgi:hypothetical protein
MIGCLGSRQPLPGRSIFVVASRPLRVSALRRCDPAGLDRAGILLVGDSNVAANLETPFPCSIEYQGSNCACGHCLDTHGGEDGDEGTVAVGDPSLKSAANLVGRWLKLSIWK